jgi:hypothetical protein
MSFEERFLNSINRIVFLGEDDRKQKAKENISILLGAFLNYIYGTFFGILHTYYFCEKTFSGEYMRYKVRLEYNDGKSDIALLERDEAIELNELIPFEDNE